jgi:hypothetical protein
MAYEITTQSALRAAFWQGFTTRPKRLRNGDYPTDIRVEFVDFIDHLARDGIISEALASRATL